MENRSSSSPGVFNFTTLLEMLCSQVLVSSYPSPSIGTLSTTIAATAATKTQLWSWHHIFLADKLQVVRCRRPQS